MLFKINNLAQLTSFDSIIDARTTAEFLIDHIPNALNAPTLNDEQRIEIGTLYKQTSAFDAKKKGAAYAARNIAEHIEKHFFHHPKSWRPLVYCWRGGNRSGSMVTILRAIGWQAHQLEGGYKAYRKLVIQTLETLPASFRFQVIGGETGSGKTRLLSVLKQHGAQVLDLENLAQHRGSVLGRLELGAQPPQKWFDSQLVAQLSQFDPSQPIFIESESKKIGLISLPDSLMTSIRRSPLWLVQTPMNIRIDYLCQDYAEYILHPDRLKKQLNYLLPLHGQSQLNHWMQAIDRGHYHELIRDLLIRHYDPLYQKSTQQLGVERRIQTLKLDNLSTETLNRAATHLINAVTSQ
ncbi:MAG: tRNA 2-selenouridine(34) synthase MnmH [Gammaproteobacteria bacterium]|nr:tRNA 2-selenouridine(34) synthase MnmH [Gammaproteobacteria bacterium]